MAAGRVSGADFDGDGIDDLLFRDRSRGDHRLALVSGGPGLGTSVRSLLLSRDTLRTRGFEIRTGDFDGDGIADVLDRDLDDGRIRIRLLDGTGVRERRSVHGPARAAAIQAIADFTGDGRDDVLLRGGLSGAWKLLALDGTTILDAGSGELGVARDMAWRFTGTADFNGDGRADLLLRRADTLQWRVVLLDGLRVLANVMPPFLPAEARWQLEAVHDLDGDARADLLLRNYDSGAWFAWHMNGTQALPSSGPVAMTNGLLWQLQLLDDLNGDNNVDAVLARHDNGALRVELLQGSERLAGSGVVGGDPDPAVRVAGSGDYDGDGVRELLMSDPTGWKTLDVRVPAAPVERALAVEPPRIWPSACEAPKYHQYGSPSKPADAGADTAFLTWLPPTTRENGEALCAHDLWGYRIIFTRAGASETGTVQMADPRADRKLLGPLGAGTWTFRILSIDSNGFFSQSSAGISKTIP
jgi:hypothetical protein